MGTRCYASLCSYSAGCPPMSSAYSEFGVGGGVDKNCPAQGDTCAFLSKHRRGTNVGQRAGSPRVIPGDGNVLFILSPQNITCENRCHPPIRVPKGVLTLPLYAVNLTETTRSVPPGASVVPRIHFREEMCMRDRVGATGKGRAWQRLSIPASLTCRRIFGMIFWNSGID